mmetsp:Transcript_2945/g.10193  ORF Transcript_2945/g.10193 Transcript_2945/m.10193 type:complete len:219 (+) Transcript_2945:71-727(+)
MLQHLGFLGAPAKKKPFSLVDIFVYSLRQGLLWHSSDDSVHLLPVLEDHDGGNAPDAVLRRDGGRLVRVQLDGLQLPLVLLRELVHERGYHAAGSAPRRPEVYQHGKVGLEDLLLPIGVRHGVRLWLGLVGLGPHAGVPRPSRGEAEGLGEQLGRLGDLPPRGALRDARSPGHRGEPGARGRSPLRSGGKHPVGCHLSLSLSRLVSPSLSPPSFALPL